MDAVIAGMRPKRSAMGPQIAEHPQPSRKIAALTWPYQPMFAGVASTPMRGSSVAMVGASTSPKTVQLNPSIAQPPNEPQKARRCSLFSRNGSPEWISARVSTVLGGSWLIVTGFSFLRLASLDDVCCHSRHGPVARWPSEVLASPVDQWAWSTG